MKKFLLFSSLYGFSNAFLKLLGFIVFLWIARTLSVTEYAFFSLLYSTQQGLVGFTSAGIYESIVGFVKDKNTEIERTNLLAESNIIFILLSIISILILFLYLIVSNTFHPIYFLIFSTSILISFSMLRSRMVRINENHFLSISYISIVQAAMFGAGTCFFFIEKSSYFFFLGSLIGLLISIFVLLLFDSKESRIFKITNETKIIFYKTIPYFFVAVLVWLNSYGNNFIIQLFFEDKEISKFTFLLSICSILLVLAGSINQVWGPKYINLFLKVEINKLESLNSMFYKFLTLLVGAFAGGTLLIFPSLLVLVGGNLANYSNFTFELSLLFAAYIGQNPRWQCENYLMANGMGSTIFKQNLISSIVGIIVSIALMFFIGPIGIYYGFLLKMVLHSVLTIVQTYKKYPLKLDLFSILISVLMLYLPFLFTNFDLNLSLSIVLYILLTFLIIGIYFIKNKNKINSIFTIQ